jgi:hypothetical protein
VPEETTRVIELEAGNVDMITHAPPKDADRLEAAGFVNLVRAIDGVNQVLG